MRTFSIQFNSIQFNSIQLILFVCVLACQLIPWWSEDPFLGGWGGGGGFSSNHLCLRCTLFNKEYMHVLQFICVDTDAIDF